jgi:hypothetical protein
MHLRLALIVLLAVLSMAAVSVTAPAQTATNLKCRGCVGKKDLGKKAVRPKHIKKRAIKSKHIRDSAVQTKAMKDGAVETRKISNGAVTAEKLADTAKPTGVDFALGATSTALTTSTQSIVSTTLTAPVAGYAVVMAQWQFWTQADTAQGFCSVDTVPDHNAQPAVRTQADDMLGLIHYDAASLTWAFPIPAGDTTFYLNCVRTGASMFVANPAITAMFVPNRY